MTFLANKTILVTGGAGAVGHYALQLASWAGARVIATASSDEKAQRSREGGAAHVIKHRFVINRVMAATMEPRGSVGVYDKASDRYTIYTTLQRALDFREPGHRGSTLASKATAWAASRT